jgi:hypothetical protein
LKCEVFLGILINFVKTGRLRLIYFIKKGKMIGLKNSQTGERHEKQNGKKDVCHFPFLNPRYCGEGEGYEASRRKRCEL